MACIVANAASYVPFIAVALWILPRGCTAAPADQKVDRPHLFAGLRRILASSHMSGALLTVLTTSMLCGPLIVFCPVLVKDVLHGDASQFSLAIGAFGVGGLLGAVALLGVDPAYDGRRIARASPQFMAPSPLWPLWTHGPRQCPDFWRSGAFRWRSTTLQPIHSCRQALQHGSAAEPLASTCSRCAAGFPFGSCRRACPRICWECVMRC